MAAITLLPKPTRATPRSQAALLPVDWEAPAGGAAPLPTIQTGSFTYVGDEDEHLRGQSCMLVEPMQAASETCRVRFACGCELRVLRRLLASRTDKS